MASQQLIDLTNESALVGDDVSVGVLVDEIRAEHNRDGVRGLLSALQLKPVSGPMVDVPKGNVLDLAVYRATGDRRLATLFGTAA